MKQASLILLSCLTLLLTGCVNNPFSSYKTISDDRLAKIYAGKTSTAISPDNTSDVLYNMEYGLLLRLQQQYTPSNIYFARAQQSLAYFVNSWSNRKSGQVTSEALSILVNDNINDYQPKGYEKSFLATFYALNYIGLNNLDDARVEVKQMYQLEQATQNYNEALYHAQELSNRKENTDKTSRYLQQQIQTQYNFPDLHSPNVLALKNSYQNAFGHYLAGFVFEALNEPSLARPGYVKAGQLSPNNVLIQKSIDNLDQGVRPKPGYTDLLIVEEVGHAPQIESVQISIPINLNLVNPNASCLNFVNIFYPKLIFDTQNEAVYNYALDEQPVKPYPLVDVNLMVQRNLLDSLPHLISRNVAAALRNIAMNQAICSQQNQSNPQGNQALQIGSGILGILIDRSDERTLTLLPNKINISRFLLPYGKHSLELPVYGMIHKQEIILNQPYQLLTFRILGSQVFFDLQDSMHTTQKK